MEYWEEGEKGDGERIRRRTTTNKRAVRWSTLWVAEIIDLSTARPKWRLDGPALLGHLLYSLVNHSYANRYHHHLV